MGEGRVNAADDVIGTLSARVTELSKRVALLEAELQSAEKRIEIYEDHDSQIQEALSGALKAAYQIRQRAEVAAEQILEQAREQRRMILSEIERLQDERDRLQDEIAAGRRSGLAPLSARPLSSDTAASELRAVASEALKGLFEEIVEDMRAAQGRSAPPPAPRAPQTRETTPQPRRDVRDQPRREAPGAGREPSAVTREDIESAAPATYEAMARMRRGTIEDEEMGAPAPLDVAPVAEPETETAPAPVEEVKEVAASETMRPISEGPSMEVRVAEEQREIAQRTAEFRELGARVAAERREAEQREAERREAERREARERLEAEARERLEAEARAAAERETAERAAAERAAAERAEAERAAELAVTVRAAAERAAAAQAEYERAAAERAAAERIAAEHAAAEHALRAAPPLEVVRTPVDMGEIAPPRVEAASPTSDIQLMLSPVASFPRLVEIERQIQALPVVRTLYVRDFRGGSATLAVALRSSMTPEEFAELLRGLRQPRLRLVAGSRNTIEMRVEGEAGVA
ncbi:MAG: hypothetical protein AUH85_13910 [Chloroflexi bacterium 13_1_40CM_4_68_4]|nr:MAG: hypothetical protein AUH85_13910 [Chloroflexi bacterium 13_1_40CM_4_68_4]